MSSWIRTSVALSLLLPLCAACHAPASAAAQPVDAPTAQKEAPVVSSHNYIRPSKAELKKTLNAIQFEVTQNDATEPPFRNAFWDNHQAGIYVDVATGEPLFSSLDKFESGTGWPSFTRPIEDGRVVSKSDGTLGMARIEVRSHAGDSHLGHVFDDGPAPTGERYCINSASLRFVPAPRLAAEGYGAYAARFKGRAVAPIAPSTNNACAVPPPGERPGCEATLDSVVLQGGPSAAAGLHDVTGVLEVDPEMGGKSVRVVFDPQRIAVAQLMDRWVSLGGERSAR